MGGAPGTAACQSYNNPMGAAGHSGDACYQLTYPASGFYGDNILAADCTTFTSDGAGYELAVMGPTTFPTVQVTLTLLSLTGTRTAPLPQPGWAYAVDGDWRVKAFDTGTQQQIFQTRPLSDNETNIRFSGAGSARVDIYDCDPNTPTRSKIISWAPAQP